MSRNAYGGISAVSREDTLIGVTEASMRVRSCVRCGVNIDTMACQTGSAALTCDWSGPGHGASVAGRSAAVEKGRVEEDVATAAGAVGLRGSRNGLTSRPGDNKTTVKSTITHTRILMFMNNDKIIIK